MNEDTKTPEITTQDVNPEVPAPAGNQPSQAPAGTDSGRDNNSGRTFVNDEDTSPNDDVEEKKHPGGRPTDYSIEMVSKAQEYVDSCEDEEIQQVVGLSAKGTELYKNKLNVHIPTIEGLARFLRITKPTIYDWEKLHPEFSYVIGELRQKQAEALVNKGLSGDYNPTIAKVLLTKHGYVEKSETDLTTKGEKITTDNQTAANEAIMKYLNGNSGNNTNQRSPENTTAVPVPGNGN